MAALRARLAQKPPGYRFTIGRVLAIYGAIMVAILLAALDQTIVATALPAIVDDLGGLTSYSWVITSYILAMTVTVPLYGKLGDIYGRRLLWLVAISIFLFGSALCGLAQSMNQLVAFRVVQGMGAGGLFALAHATIGVIVPPRFARPLPGPVRVDLRPRVDRRPAAGRDLRRPGQLALGVLRQRAGRPDRHDGDRDRDPEADCSP